MYRGAPIFQHYYSIMRPRLIFGKITICWTIRTMLVAGSLSSVTEIERRTGGFLALVGEDGHLESLEGCLGYL